ncbi:MAG: SDR family oxidoreductase [Nitrospirae bacterium]|nr:SDR family oxidoreductase [Nitrospirota bacterium]
MKLKGKVAIITGGARGIGKAIATLFAQEGAKVVIVSRTPDEISNTVSDIKNNGGEAIGIVGDISRWNDVERIKNNTVSTFGTIDVLLNNAGVQKPIGPFIDIDIEEWMRNFQINLFGTVLCCKAVLPVMIKKRRGKIINLSGGGSTSPRINFTAYGTAKTAVVRFTETLAEELKDYNIQVNTIAPGAVNTKMLSEVLEAGDAAGKKELDEAKVRAEKGGTPPELAAELALFLASDKSNGLTGRLISALWDDWRNFNDDTINQVMKSDKYTLRRIT